MQYSPVTNKLQNTKTVIKDNLIVRPSNGQFSENVLLSHVKFWHEFTIRSAVSDYTDFRKLK